MMLNVETLLRCCKPYTNWHDPAFVVQPSRLGEHYVALNDRMMVVIHQNQVSGIVPVSNEVLPSALQADVECLMTVDDDSCATRQRIDNYAFHVPPTRACDCHGGVVITWGDDEEYVLCHLCHGTSKCVSIDGHYVNWVRISESAYLNAAIYVLLADVLSQADGVTAFITDDAVTSTHVFKAAGCYVEVKPLHRIKSAKEPSLYWDARNAVLISHGDDADVFPF